MHDTTVFVAHIEASFICDDAKVAKSRANSDLIPYGQTDNERVVSSRQCRVCKRKCVSECQEPHGTQRRVYVLNVTEVVVHVQTVSLKRGPDYGRAGAVVSRCETIDVVC